MSVSPVEITRRGFAILFVALFLHACATAAPPAAKKDARITGSYVTLISDEGRQRIERSPHRVDYVSLMATFIMQERQTLCSVATGVTILNALPLHRPVDPRYAPYPFFTQANYFNDRVDAIITRDTTLKIGQTLQQAASVMAAHGAVTKAYHAADSSIDEFRRIARANMDTRTDFIAVNYLRNHVGQPRGAHFSPLAAYDEPSDSFLVLDVARYKFPPVWVTVADLFDAMNTLDTDSGKTRGFIVVSATGG
ncbi:MAG: glutathione gamma-glutamylcysteinyltransferase [Alphaproteobacteria bacterium]|nr:glutathione gamma-glutamylcysteinyltransferase [Alphaproteobacteria bacterium]